MLSLFPVVVVVVVVVHIGSNHICCQLLLYRYFNQDLEDDYSTALLWMTSPSVPRVKINPDFIISQG